jgi:hypothetical protein
MTGMSKTCMIPPYSPLYFYLTLPLPLLPLDLDLPFLFRFYQIPIYHLCLPRRHLRMDYWT